MIHSELHTISHTGAVRAVAFSPPSASDCYLASASDTLRVWEFKLGDGTFQELTIPDSGRSQGSSVSVAFVPANAESDNSTRPHLISAGADNEVRLWRIAGRSCKELKSHMSKRAIRCLACSAEHVAWGDDSGEITFLNLDTGNSYSRPVAKGEPILALAFDKTGEQLAYGTGYDLHEHPPLSPRQKGRLGIWKVKEDQEVTLEHNWPVLAVAFNDLGNRLAAGYFNALMCTWEFKENEWKRTPYYSHSMSVNGVAFTQDEQSSEWVVTASRDRRINSHQVNEDLVRTIYGHEGSVRSISVSPDRKYIASAGDDQTIKLWTNYLNPTVDHFLAGFSLPVTAVAFSADSEHLAAGSLDGSVRIYDKQNWTAGDEPTQIVCPCEGEMEESVYAVAFAPDNSRLATACANGGIRVTNWPAQESNRAEPAHLYSHQGKAFGVAISSDSLLASAGEDGVKLWKFSHGKGIGDGENIDLLGDAPKETVYGVAFSPDGRFLAAAGQDSFIRICDVRARKFVHQMGSDVPNGHQRDVTAVAFSDDYLVSAGKDHTIKLWRAGTWEWVRDFHGHTDAVFGVALSKNGQRIASVSWDQTMRVWDRSTGRQVLLKDLFSPGFGVTFSPNGNYIAAGVGVVEGPDEEVHGQARLWDGSPSRTAAKSSAP